MLAISSLEDLIPRYQNAGLTEDAARVDRAIRERAEQARGEMKRISVPVEIPREEMDKFGHGPIRTAILVCSSELP